MRQTTDRVLMIRPRHFGFNPETAGNNTFQANNGNPDPESISAAALAEFEALVDVMRKHGIHVDIVEDTGLPVKPDAVFPNNWLSMHEDGAVITYPMLSPLRRQERREDIIGQLETRYAVARRYAFEQYEDEGRFLEGTGSMVFDHENRIAYACISPRTDLELLHKYCVLRRYEPCTFHAVSDGVPVYHTNVVMAIGQTYVVICLDCIPEETERQKLFESFNRTGKEVFEISIEQMKAFAGNMIQMRSSAGKPLCVMSSQAFASLTTEQIDGLRKHNEIIHSPVDTIERYGGGSVRCMIAENFLPPL